MRNKNVPLTEEVQELLEKAIVEEATEAVWKIFEEALEKMDESSLCVLENHFNRKGEAEVSLQTGLKEEETKKVLLKSKRELRELMRREKNVRQ